MVADGVFQNLKGRPCTDSACRPQTASSDGEARPAILGKMVGKSQLSLETEACSLNISRDTVAYRCELCRRRYSVVDKHPLFEIACGHGAASPSLVIFCWWSLLESKTISVTARELNLSSETVSRIYNLARMVIAEDAVALQSEITFGGRGADTTEVEADESSFSSWTITGEGGAPDHHYWYVWVGVLQRGDPKKLYMTPFFQSEDLPLGISRCVGEKRTPPLNQECWAPIAAQLFPETANVLLMTDGAPAYASVKALGIIQHASVNHTEGE